MRGMAAKLRLTISNIEQSRNVKRILFDPHVKLLNFKAKSSNLETNRTEKMMEINTSDAG
jgi:hypothetical protein